MLESRAKFFRTGAAECYAAAQAANDSAIKQAYLELAQGWRILTDEVERLISQQWRPRAYSWRSLPDRSLDDFYELRSAGGGRRGTKHAIEHPLLGGRRESAATGSKDVAAARRGRS
jgi:hypothetical protein